MKLIDDNDARFIYVYEKLDSITFNYGLSIILYDINNSSMKNRRWIYKFIKEYKDEIQRKAFLIAITKVKM